MSIYVWNKEIKSLFSGCTTKNYSAMRGPCPKGFHVPSKAEWQWVITIMSSLSLSSLDAWKTNLHLVPAGCRIYPDATISNGNYYAYYWSCTHYSNESSSALTCESTPKVEGGSYRGQAFSVRWFKDSFEEPTSSRTVIQWTLWWAWIFRNQTEWLISITSDWTTWYTIQDKNLWATQVYNRWDALTEANAGYMYQWGNNYWFPSTWSISKTSTTQVDTNWYWPWNYYDSDTFIMGSRNRSSVNNKDLRWWVTWITYDPTEAKAVYLWDAKVRPTIINFATQWPAPDGFHVPLITEWEWVNTIMSWLGLTTWDWWRINLHMPFAGYRNTVSTLNYQGSNGYYWSSSPYGSGAPSNARDLYLDSSNVRANYNNGRAFGIPVRCFKDSYETPTSSWTVVQWTLGSAWIFWNQSEWLISITSNWTTWYTIQDKNLWATTVYNDGDTLTQANMWNMYQWWNNYWFHSTWSVTTSSTKVNAQNYWPWNYYSSSTFITWGMDWSSAQNDNLRGWVDWNVPIS